MAVDLFVTAKVLSKLFAAGVGLYRNAKSHDDLQSSLNAIEAFLGAGGDAASDFAQHVPLKVTAKHVALIVSAFGEAWKSHFAPRLGMERAAITNRHVDSATRWALTELPSVAFARGLERLEMIDRLLGDVTNTPYYEALWKAFTNPALPDLNNTWSHPLIEANGEDDRRAFERTFRLAYADAVASPAGQDVRAYLVELTADRTRLVRELMVRDLSTWGNRHVFGNVAAHTRLPDMPLSEMYVEPRCSRRPKRSGTDVEDESPRKVIRELESLLESHQLVVVTAHFGHGKSLTARMFAHISALTYLSEAQPKFGLPVFIKCLEDLVSAEPKLPKMVERALWRQVGLGYELGLKDTDPAFGIPNESERAIFLIDGLDEVALSSTAVAQLFEHLRGQAAGKHKIVVFSRPEVLPEERLRELRIPIIELLPFSKTSEGQISEWITKWNTHSGERPKLSLSEVSNRGLLELAETPILLFMIAETWGTVNDAHGGIRQANLYEAFLSRIARGKHDDDCDNHRPIADAAKRLQAALLRAGRVDTDTPIDEAMLWALSRIAWESYCLEQREKLLTQRKVVEVLAAEVDVDDEAAHQALCDGVLLALQADFTPGSSRILFGHRSFREFLVARYWERSLAELLKRDSAEWRRHEVRLLGGRLLGREDRSFTFLLELLAAWEPERRRQLVRWAEQTFNDERLSFVKDSSDAVVMEDRRSYVREAALAIGSCVEDSTGIHAANNTVLRSLLSWFWAKGEQPIIKAPRFKSQWSRLEGVTLAGADLTNADLKHSDFTGAHLISCDLPNANLESAKFDAAQVSTTSLKQARLRDAQMASSYFFGVDFSEADVSGAAVSHAKFHACNMEKTNFERANLVHAHLSVREAIEVGARFTEAKLEDVTELIQGVAAKGDDWLMSVMRAISRATSHPNYFLFADEHDEPDGANARGRAVASEHILPMPNRIRFQLRVPTQDGERVIAELKQLPIIVNVGVKHGQARWRRVS